MKRNSKGKNKVEKSLFLKIREPVYSTEPYVGLTTSDFETLLAENQESSLPTKRQIFLVSAQPGKEETDAILVVVVDFKKSLSSAEFEFFKVWKGLLRNHLAWIERLETTEQKIHKDDLTGLGNARYLDVSLEQEMRRSERFGERFSLLFIDVDNFKSINDRHGHLNGSRILSQLGGLLGETAREVDRVCRYGGDEFVIILVQADTKKAYLVAERLREKVAQFPFVLMNGDSVSLTLSIGITTCPDHASGRDELLSLADRCMYQSKQRGKNLVTVFKPFPQQGDDLKRSVLSKDLCHPPDEPST